MTATAPDGLIELRLQSLEQLFDPFDPFPLPTRDLAESAEDFVVGWARDLPLRASLALRIHIPREEADAEKISALRSAITTHFLYRARRTQGDMREQLAIARLSLFIGLAVLGVCMVIRHFLRDVTPNNPIGGFLSEGVVIVGWVANWRPIELLLYEWWPLARRHRLFQRLAAAPVDVVSSAQASLDADQRQQQARI
jgi:hypothetical protein